MKITVSDLLETDRKNLRLELLAGKEGIWRRILSPEIGWLGTVFSGFDKTVIERRIQVLGDENLIYFKKIDKKKKKKIISQIFKKTIPCLIIASRSRLKAPKELIEFSNTKSAPLLKTSFSQTEFTSRLGFFLENAFSSTITVQGVLVEVYGLGVLIFGETGIGKSECALELIKRGHRLIADDLIRVRKRAGRILIGFSQGTLGHYMELRGLGIIDIKNLFGVGAIRNAIKIELVVQLEKWRRSKEYERLGMDERFKEILGIKLPEAVIPVRPGRNLAIIIEIAAMNYRMKSRGYSSAREFDEKLIEITKKK